MQEVEGDTGAIAVGGIGFGGMGGAITKKHDSAGFELYGHGPLFGHLAMYMVVGVGVAIVQVFFLEGIVHDVDGAVGDGRIVYGDPHGGAF